MLGQDCERMISSINSIKVTIEEAIKQIGSSASYQITTEGTHGETEVSNPYDISILNAVSNMASNLSSDVSKMSSLGNNLYTSTSSFNNSCGSPWAELATFYDSLQNLSLSITWMGDRITALSVLTIALSRAIDAKWAIIYYHDYIQRGYDHVYNDNNPSITTKAGLHRETIGNVTQDYDTNVNIPKESIDPY
jgi:hypothetical protein